MSLKLGLCLASLMVLGSVPLAGQAGISSLATLGDRTLPRVVPGVPGAPGFPVDSAGGETVSLESTGSWAGEVGRADVGVVLTAALAVIVVAAIVLNDKPVQRCTHDCARRGLPRRSGWTLRIR